MTTPALPPTPVGTAQPTAQPDALDRWWARYGNGPRFTVINGNTLDSALSQYTGLEHTPLGVGGMTADVRAAYGLDEPALVACVAAIRAASAQPAQPAQPIAQQPAAPATPATPTGSTAPVANTPPAPPIPTAPLTPGSVVTPEHHNAVMHLLGQLGHGIGAAASLATPENLATLAQLVALFKKK